MQQMFLVSVGKNTRIQVQLSMVFTSRTTVELSLFVFALRRSILDSSVTAFACRPLEFCSKSALVWPDFVKKKKPTRDQPTLRVATSAIASLMTVLRSVRAVRKVAVVVVARQIYVIILV